MPKSVPNIILNIYQFMKTLFFIKNRNKMITTLILGAVMFSSQFMMGQVELEGRDLKRYREAYSYAQSTNNKKAIGILRELQVKNPDEINVNYNLGLCYMNMSGNPDSALYFLNRVKELDSEGEWNDARSELCIAIARAHQLKYDYEGALTVYEEIESNDTEGTWKETLQREREICENALVLMNNPVKLEVARLGDQINSTDDDYRPVLSSDMSTMLFTSRRRNVLATDFRYDDGQSEEGIFMAKHDGNRWGPARRIDNIFAEEFVQQETATCLTNNGTELYIVRDGNIWVSKYDSIRGAWNIATKLPEPINHNRSNETFAYVTEDGGMLYFTSDRSGGVGGFDIYRSYRLPNGNWGVPQNLGPTINTPYDEDCPIVHPTKNMLYFSSKGHNTMGGYDIFYSIMNPDSTFAAVNNIGYPINTPDDDRYFVPTAQKDMAYYSSIQWAKGSISNGYDIFEVTYEEPEINKLVLIEGYVKALPGSSITITAECDGEEMGIYRPNPDSKRFVIILESRRNYTIVATDGNKRLTEKVSLKENESYAKMGKTKSIGTFDFTEGQPTSLLEMIQPGALAQDKTPIELRNTPEKQVANMLPQSGNTLPEGKKYYTVQVMSLRDKCVPKRLRNLKPEDLIEFEYRNGWFVYSVGKYENKADANAHKEKIVDDTPYKDSFVRSISHYQKYVK